MSKASPAVRESSDEETIEKLELEAYEEKADEDLNEICRDLRKRLGIVDAQISHFIGEFNVSEDLVYVVVAGAHRREVFKVLEEAVLRYKKEAPIFKKEYFQNKQGVMSSRWVGKDTPTPKK